MRNWPAIALLAATGILHVYQFWLTPPSLPMVTTVLFGLIYLGIGIVLIFAGRRVLWTARIVPAVGAVLALGSVAQGQQKLLPWVLPFVMVDLVVLWLVWRKRPVQT